MTRTHCSDNNNTHTGFFPETSFSFELSDEGASEAEEGDDDREGAQVTRGPGGGNKEF